jgi:hypothetical protein
MGFSQRKRRKMPAPPTPVVCGGAAIFALLNVAGTLSSPEHSPQHSSVLGNEPSDVWSELVNAAAATSHISTPMMSNDTDVEMGLPPPTAAVNMPL